MPTATDEELAAWLRRAAPRVIVALMTAANRDLRVELLALFGESEASFAQRAAAELMLREAGLS